MIDEHQRPAQHLADLLAQENAALRRLDFLAGAAGTCHRGADADRPDCRPRLRASGGDNAIQRLWRPRTPDPRCRPGRIYPSLIVPPCPATRVAVTAWVYDHGSAVGRIALIEPSPACESCKPGHTPPHIQIIPRY